MELPLLRTMKRTGYRLASFAQQMVKSLKVLKRKPSESELSGPLLVPMLYSGSRAKQKAGGEGGAENKIGHSILISPPPKFLSAPHQKNPAQGPFLGSPETFREDIG